MRVQLRIESLVHGGDALGRADGRVVFVPGGAPGDLVEAEVVDEPKGDRFLRGKLLRVIEPGAARIGAPCGIVDRCGGCPIQHVSIEEQLRAKEALVRDALARIGGFDNVEVLPIVRSPKEFHYRRRARLHRAAGGAFGFAGRGSAQVVPVVECLLFEPDLQAFANDLRAHALPDVADLGLDTSDTGQRSLDLRTERPPGPALRKRAHALLEAIPRLRGITLGIAGSPEIIGDPVIADAPAPARFRTRADLFAQANRSATPSLVRAALDALGPAREGRVLELFCGSGTFTLPLLATARSVVGIEAAAASLALLRKSAAEAGLDRLQLIAGDAGKVRIDGPFDAVLLDPPRTGAAAILKTIVALRPPRIVYVSCDAPTFARDAKKLDAAGYRVERVQPFDLFPQTAHLELVVSIVAT